MSGSGRGVVARGEAPDPRSGVGEDGAWQPAFPGQRAPFPVGHETRLEHGAYGARVAPRAAELADQLRAIVPAYRPSDEPTVRLAAGVLARIEAASEWLVERGLLDAAGMPQPVLKVLSTWENSAGRLLAELGCTPASRARLGLDVALARRAMTATGLAEAVALEGAAVVDDERPAAAGGGS